MAYPGGKGSPGVSQTIINQMPPHERYIEPFLGGGAIMIAKRPARINIGCDLSRIALENVATQFGPKPKGGLFYFRKVNAFDFLQEEPFSHSDLIYADPPYMRSLRRSPDGIYEFELIDDQHRILLDILRELPARIIVSGYPSPLYDRMLSSWRRIEFQSMTRGGPATEVLWLNFPEPEALHDYRFLGETFRERERIKRKQERWRKKWKSLPLLERRAILAAIQENSEG